MVVDDEKDIELLFRQKFRKEIKENIVEFIFCFSAEESLNYLSTQKDADLVLILSDINMPGLSGIELLKILKEKHPNIRVYMITAYGDDKNYSLSMQYGADKFITKPIDFNDLKIEILNIT